MSDIGRGLRKAKLCSRLAALLAPILLSLMVGDATFTDVRPMGEGKHVRFTVQSGGARARAVAFRTGGRLPVREGVAVEATFKLEVNEWNGVSEPRLVLRQAKPADPPLPDEPDPGEVCVDDGGELVLFALP